MILGGSTSLSGHNGDVEPDLIASLINLNFFSEAYQLLKLKGNLSHIPDLFNIALCQFEGEDYAQALHSVNQAIMNLRPNLSNAPRRDSLLNVIIQKQSSQDNYRLGMTETYAKYFPQEVQDRLLRLKIDCLVKLEQWNEVITLGQKLQTKNFKNVEAALALAKTNK